MPDHSVHQPSLHPPFHRSYLLDLVDGRGKQGQSEIVGFSDPIRKWGSSTLHGIGNEDVGLDKRLSRPHDLL